MKEQYYLDNAATTWPKPESVYTHMDQFFRNYGVNPGRAGHEMAVEAERMITDTRRMLADFFNHQGDPHRVVFTQNATDSLNMALFGLIKPGDHVITTRLEHNSVTRPTNHMARDMNVGVTHIQRDTQGYVDPDDFRKAITSKTKVIIVNHASNVLGCVQDIAAIGQIAREAGVLFVLDTCQTAGVLDLDMQKNCIDVLTFTGHKGLFGPMGIGGMVVGENIDITPSRVGGTGVDSIAPYQPDAYPFRLEAGTVSVPGIAGLHAAQKWFADLGKQQDGIDDGASHKELCSAALKAVEAREVGHIEKLADAFRSMDGVKVYGPEKGQPRVSTLSINVQDLPADQVGTMLDADHYVCVRAGLHCAPWVHEDQGTVEQNGTVRFSPGYFADDEDIQQAIDGIKDIAEG